ncbi:MAG: cupin-like domain-containing protein, partial [Vitreoscilla sp.]
YVRGCRPVVLTDMARDWPALRRWSFDELRHRRGAHSLTENDELLRRPEFRGLLDDVGPLPDVCDPSMLERAASLSIGPAGMRTPLRQDTQMLLQTQITGRKRWRLVSPLSGPSLYHDVGASSPVDFEALDLQRFPDAAKVKVLEVLVEPGETLFLPLAWWHQETALDNGIALSLANLSFPNTFDFSPAAAAAAATK